MKPAVITLFNATLKIHHLFQSRNALIHIYGESMRGTLQEHPSTFVIGISHPEYVHFIYLYLNYVWPSKWNVDAVRMSTPQKKLLVVHHCDGRQM